MDNKSKKRIIGLVAIFLAFCLINIDIPLVSAGYEDFDNWIEDEEEGASGKSADEIQWGNPDDMHIDFIADRRETDLLYLDSGDNYWSDFMMEFNVYVDDIVGGSGASGTCWALADEIDDITDFTGDYLAIFVYCSATNNSFRVRYGNNGSLTTKMSPALTLDQWYYVRLGKSGTTFWVQFYTNSARTTTWGANYTITVVLSKYRYVYACGTLDSGANQQVIFDLEDYDLMDLTTPTMSNLDGATGVEETNTTLWGNITDDGGDTPVYAWFYMGSTDGADVKGNWDSSVNKSTQVEGTPYSHDYTSLVRGERYYYRAFGINGQGESFAGSSESFLTKPDNLATLVATSIDTDTINISWTFNTGGNDNRQGVDKIRIMYKTTGYPTSATDGTLLSGSEFTAPTGAYTHNGLDENQDYYYGAWTIAIDESLTSNGTVKLPYGDGTSQATAKTNAFPTVEGFIPVNNSYEIFHKITTVSGWINDTDAGDTFNYTIECSNGDTKSENGVTQGQKSLTLTTLPLDYFTNYTVWFNVTQDGETKSWSSWFYTINNTAPTISNENPTHNTSGIALTPNLAVYVADFNGDTMNVLFQMYNDTTGKYETVGTNNSVNNGTYRALSVAMVDTENTTYFWKVFANDTFGGNTQSSVYNFTTLITPMINISLYLPLNNSVVNTISYDNFTVNLTSANPSNLTIVVEKNNSGVWDEVYNQTFTDRQTGLTTDVNLTANNTGWMGRWYAYANDTVIQNTTSYFYFTATDDNTPPVLSGEIPINNIINISSIPVVLSINVTDDLAIGNATDGEGLRIRFSWYNSTHWENLTGWWNTTYDNGNGTYTCQFPNATQSLTTYVWRVECEDSGGNLVTASYNFTMGNVNFPPVQPYNLNPTNNSVVAPTDSVILSWLCTDPNGDTLYFTVRFGTVGNLTEIATNTTSYSVGVGTLAVGTYNWYVVAYDGEYYNTSDTLTLFCNYTNHTYNIFIRHEENFTIYDLKTNYTYLLYVYFDNATIVENITSNGFDSSVNFTYFELPNSMRLYVYPSDDANISLSVYYRSRIPTAINQNITFLLPFDDSTLLRYILTLDDQSGYFTPPSTFIRIYVFNQTQTFIVHEDFFTVDYTTQLYLIYTHRYYNAIIKGNNRWENSNMLDATANTEQTITIYPYLLNELILYWEVINISAYHDNTTNSIVFIYIDTYTNTNWVNITIYENFNGTNTVLFATNFSSHVFTVNLLNQNITRLHYVMLNVSHGDIGNKTLKLFILPIRDRVYDIDILDDLLDNFFGDNPVGSWVSVFVGFLLMGIIIRFDDDLAFLGLIVAGLTIAGLQYYIGLTAFNSVVGVFLVAIGFLSAIEGGQKG